MNKKLLLLGLILAFSFCLTEWGADQSAFIFEMEFQFFSDLKGDNSAFFHSLIFSGLIGQIGLLSGIFLAKPKKWLMLGSLTLLSIMVLFFLLAGLLSMNFWIILSTFPFWILAFFLLKTTVNKN